MRKVFVFLSLSFLFFSLTLAETEKSEEEEIEKLLAGAYMVSKDYESAIEEYREILKRDPSNTKIKAALADILSWQKKYDEAIKLYDEILAEKEDAKIRLQKARVLGWMRKHEKSLEEYKRASEIGGNTQAALEMRAKEAYWNNRVKAAIGYYKRLIEKEPRNVEVIFDLSQVYSYQSMWREAIREYKRILKIYRGHFRAKEGLEKAELIAENLFSKTGYEFFEADSSGRDNDVRRHSFFEELSYPAGERLRLNARYNLGFRTFSDFNDVTENSGRAGFEYRKNPDWWAEGFYNIFAYDKDIKAMHNFGGSLNCRVRDMGVSSLSYERKRLENNSTVIREGYYANRFKERLDLDVTKRLKIGADYLFSAYSDDNFKNEPGFDILYYLSLEPMKFSVKYRYFFREFDDKVGEYFSPKGFSTSQITLNWRHFLNKEEVFFGADDLYYDLKYDVTIDSEDIVGHGLRGEFNWDINKRLNFSIKGSVTGSSTNVYNDKSLTTSLKYYF